MASSSTAPRPTWRSITGGGTLPLRKPGMFTCLAIRWYAASRLGLSSANSTSMVSLARVAFSVSTALFTGDLLVAAFRYAVARCLVPGDLVQSGRQDSNLRSPAPKAGALATTLRPGDGPFGPARRV